MAERNEDLEAENDIARYMIEKDHSERIAFERELRKTLRKGDVDEITDRLTPRTLAKCDTNALFMAMEVSLKLRRKADEKGPGAEEFTKLANSVEEFINCLLEPLKSDTESRDAFGDSLDDVIDFGIEQEQKKLFTHPVLYNLMEQKWWGMFRGHWAWMLLNFWCLFDIVLFPVLFTVFYIKHDMNKTTHANKELHRKDLFVCYWEYFTTPYFVFIRDTLSYLVLLGLHFALCLQSSSIQLSFLEWAILVFFLGRMLMEGRQFLDMKLQQENDENETKSHSKLDVFLQRCTKYLSDRWNILDLMTLLIYIVTFLLRIVTWAVSESVTDNRALVTSGYLYGLNTILLTFRAFGHVMETVKSVGAIQIALFHIIDNVATIFWQLIATILAFSIAITKVYMAERSFVSDNRNKETACKSSGALAW